MAKTTEREVRRISLQEWEAEGAALFGPDKLQWAFVCPVCGNVQRAEDFRPFKDQGATPETVYQSCLGRFVPGRRAFGTNKAGAPKKPCDFAMGGLFRLCSTIVQDTLPGGQPKEVRVFEFMRKTKAREAKE